MEIKFTKEFREKAIFAENGTKFVLRGFALLPHFNYADDEIEDLTLKQIVDDENEIITNETKRATDLLDKLFDVQYIPNLELKGDNCERFGSYKFHLNRLLNSAAVSRNEKLSTDRDIEAVILIGETYKETATQVESTGKSYLAAVLKADQGSFTLTDGKDITINLQFTLAILQEGETLTSAEVDENYWRPTVSELNPSEIYWETGEKSTWFVPSASKTAMPRKIERYSTILKKHGLDAAHIENIDWQPYTLVIAPVTDRNENIYNIKCRINIWDDRSVRCTKPQLLLSVDDQDRGHIGFEADASFFSLNEKAGDGNTCFDLFSRDTNFQSSAFQGYGVGRICGQDDKVLASFTRARDTFLMDTKNNTVFGGSWNGLYASDDNVLRDSRNIFSYASNENNLHELNGLNEVRHCPFIDSTGVNVGDGESFGAGDVTMIGAEGSMGQGLNTCITGSSENIIGIGENQFLVVDKVSKNNIFIGHKGLLSIKKPYDDMSVIFGKFNADDNRYGTYYGGGIIPYNRIMMAVGDGYYRPGRILDPETYDKFGEATSGNNDTWAQAGRGDVTKRLNVFSVESRSYIPVVHFNDYDSRPDGDDYNHQIDSFFAVRGWWDKEADKIVQGNMANQHNALFSPTTIYFTKDRAHNEEWKIRIKELELLVKDNYVKDPNTSLNTSDLDKMMKTSVKGTNVFTLPLEPKFHYTITRPGRRIEGYTKGICGKYGVKGVYARRDALPGDDWKIHFDQKDDIITLGDMVRAINTIHNRKIGYDMLNGTDRNLYTIYAYNGSLEQLWIKGIRTRAYSANDNKRYQTLVKMNYVDPAQTYSIVYSNDGHHDSFGVMNWNFNTGDDDTSTFLT